MERYVKANPKVVEFLHLQNDRTQFKDGNYLLWVQDIMPFGQLIYFDQILSKIGAVALSGEEARDEQNGITCHLLPVATDERFIVESKQEDVDGVSEETDASGAQQAEENDDASADKQETADVTSTEQKEEEGKA